MREKFEAIVNVFVEASEARAREISKELPALFGNQVSDLQIEPYYKMEGWFTIWFGVPPANESPNEFLIKTGKKLATGWDFSLGEDDEDYSGTGTWIPGPEKHFVIPETRLATLNLFCPEVNARFLAEFEPTPLD